MGEDGPTISAILNTKRNKKVRNETATACFRGDRPIKPSSELAILDAVGRGLVRSGVLPRLNVTIPEAKQSPDDPVEKFYLMGLRHFLESWDAVRGGVASMSASISKSDEGRKLAALPFLRLFAIDLSIRLNAALLLSDLSLPEGGPPAWAQNNGRGWLLKHWLKRSGSKAPSQTELAIKLTGTLEERKGMSSQGIGYWLDGTKQPSAQHQVELAEVFSGLIEGTSRGSLLTEMRRFYGLWQLCSMLAEVVGWDVVEETGVRVCGYIREAQTYVRQAGDPTSPTVQQCLLGDLWMGIWRPGGEHGNASLTGFMEPGIRMRGPWTRAEHDLVWKTDLYVCGKTAKLLSGHDGTAMQYGVAERFIPFIERIQHCYQRAAGWEAVAKAFPELVGAVLQQPFDRESAFKLMNSYHALWPENLRTPWERLAALHPLMLANHFEQLAGDEQFWRNYEAAAELWQEAVRLAPLDAYKCFRLGALFGEMGEVEKAAHWLQRASELEPTWPQPALEFGRVLLHCGQHQRALLHLSQLPREGLKQHVFGVNVLGHVLAANGLFGEASWAFRRLVELQPDNAGAYADASLYLLKALKENPKSADRKEAISMGKNFAKEAALRGDDRAAVAWASDGKGA
jgi:tetratricopeptide (TPR) repeat protein